MRCIAHSPTIRRTSRKRYHLMSLETENDYDDNESDCNDSGYDYDSTGNGIDDYGYDYDDIIGTTMTTKYMILTTKQ